MLYAETGMAVHELVALTFGEVARLAQGRVVAVLPAGAIEAHGPHLPLGTDVIIAEAMARAGAGRLASAGLEVIVLPSLVFAPAPFAAAFAGTVDVPAAAITSTIAAVAREMARHGVRLTAIANAHHDPMNVAALRAAVTELSAGEEGPRLVFPDLTRRKWAARLTEEFVSGACHAGRYETSIVLAERPELVRTDVMSGLPPNPRSLVDAIREGQTAFAAAGGPEAYFGWPAEADASEGRESVDRLGHILYDAVMEAL
jgi:creatinine amidohydrolase